MTNKIFLNLPCQICKKKIYLGQETAHTKKGVYHLECYIEQGKLEERKRISKIVEDYIVDCKKCREFQKQLLKEIGGMK